MASGHIVLIEHGPTAAERNLNSVLQDGFDCRLVRWPQLDRDFGVSAKADLVIPVALCRQSVLTTWKRRDRSQPRIPTLIVLAKNADEESLLLASQSGDDFLLWPTLASELLARVSRLIGCSKERSAAERNLLEEFGLLGLVGRTRRFVRVLRMVPKVATSSSSVLVTGETGTGKELLARAVHHLSPRKDFPFIPVDCGALPDHLFENELFGHVPGAFTDARAEQKGLAAMADRGTLFLDEVDSLTFRAQAKLLRFLQEGTYKRLGESRFSKTDVRVIAASNQDLRASVEKGEFRSDLFYRLSVIHLPLPPLRKRREDIRLLTAHYLGTLRPADEPVKTITKSAIRKLQGYLWPGNVRELFNVLERAALMSEGRQILPRHLFVESERRVEAAPQSFREGRARAVAAFERAYVEKMLVKHGGNITRAARSAKKERRSFGRLVKKYGIDPREL